MNIPQSEKEQKKSEYRNILANYIDSMIRGLIMLAIAFPLSFFVLRGVLNLEIYWIFPILIILGLILSPLLSKIKVGRKVQQKYYKFLDDKIGDKYFKNAR